MSKVLTRILTVIGGFAVVLGLIWTSIQIYKFISPDGPDLRAQAASYPLHYSPATLKKNKIAADQIEALLPLDVSDRGFLANTISHRVNSYIDAELRRMDRPFFDSQAVVVNVSNSGNREAQDLKLELRGGGLYELRRIGEQVQTAPFEGVVSLGNLRPGNTVSITLWPTFFSRYDEEGGVRISHASGVEGVEFAIPTNGIRAWPHRYPFLTFLLGTLFVTVVFQGGVVFGNKTKVKGPLFPSALKQSNSEGALTKSDAHAPDDSPENQSNESASQL